MMRPAPMPPMENLHRDLRAWARGSHPAEAGVELLVRSGLGYRADVLEATCEWVDDWPMPDAGRIHTTLRDQTLLLSGGERRVYAVAAALLVGGHLDVRDALTGVDRHNAALVLAALSHTTGALTAWPA